MTSSVDFRDESTLAALDANYLAFSCALMGASTFGEYAERGDVAVVSCGAPIVQSNVAHLKRPLAESGPALAYAASIFDRLALPYSIEFRATGDDRQRHLEGQLRAAGRVRVDRAVPGMAMTPIRPAPRVPSELAIERVATDRGREDFARTAAVGFGFPANAASVIFTRAFLERPEVEAYLGRIDGVAAATSMLFRSGDVAGIYWVATLPEARRRGLGEALTWASVSAGARAGCRVASLQASAMGQPVYERMGFKHVIDYVRYQRSDEGSTSAS